MLWLERLTEPLHLNVFSFFIYLFGSFKKKVAYDLVVRPEYAFGIYESALKAKSLGIKGISIIEFGVAGGAGLMNMIEIAKKTTKATGVQIKVYGFDTGKGMPPPIDFRDHPELYGHGDFPMNIDALKEGLGNEAELILGDIDEQLVKFESQLDPDYPIGFVSVDVDYYSSTVSALKVFNYKPSCYLPLTYIYFDDIYHLHHNSKCGELLAIKEYNERNDLRVIEPHQFIRKYRMLKNAGWLGQIFFLHVLDSAVRNNLEKKEQPRIIENPYITFEGNVNRLEED